MLVGLMRPRCAFSQMNCWLRGLPIPIEITVIATFEQFASIFHQYQNRKLHGNYSATLAPGANQESRYDSGHARPSYIYVSPNMTLQIIHG